MSTETLLEMLTYMRPAGSRAERKFINRFIRPTGAAPDTAGNYILRIGDAPVIWSAHTDTVHRDGGRQLLSVDGDVVSAPRSNCLGADDTTGIWLMLAMIEAGVSGLYLFHRAEEQGCIGSGAIANNTPELLNGYLAAVAFDRRGVDSVVTHQYGRRCCSDNFAWSLAAQLPGEMLPDPTGVFTDTAEYMDLVPECTNVSVGYLHQHTKAEVQSLAFAEELRDALLELDTGALIIERDPATCTGYDWDDGPSYSGRSPWPEWDEPCEVCGLPGGDYLIGDGLLVCRICFDKLAPIHA